jgi:uncharacterized protein YjbI with pentapeptide repeats
MHGALAVILPRRSTRAIVTSMNDDGAGTGSQRDLIDNLIDNVARDAIALEVAMQRGDLETGKVAAIRARLALATANRLAHDTDPIQPQVIERLVLVHAYLQRVLQDPRAEVGEDAFQYAQLAAAIGSDDFLVDASEADLADIELHAVSLSYANFRNARLFQCSISASALVRTRFDGCIVVRSDFARSNMTRSAWSRGAVARSRFAGAAFVDATLDRVVFTDCDLRGADLSAPGLGHRASAEGVRFVRCDLRGTCWAGRALRGVRIIDCKMHGVHGTATLEGAEIHACDMSAEGDGSQVVGAAEVLRGWGPSRHGRLEQR